MLTPSLKPKNISQEITAYLVVNKSHKKLGKSQLLGAVWNTSPLQNPQCH